MKSLQIKTAQNVTINFTLANAGQRLAAFFVDNVVKFGYLYVIALTFNFDIFTKISDDNWTQRAVNFLLILPLTCYTLYSEILMNGQTLGKMLFKIKVIKLDGFKPSIADFVIRWFLRIIDFNLFILVGVFLQSDASFGNAYTTLIVFLVLIGKLVGLLLIVFTNKNQRLGDFIANTTVIYLRDESKFSDTILENLTITYKPTYPSVIKLSDNDVRIIKTTFVSAKKQNDYKMLIKLRTKIIEVIQIQSEHKSDTEFIDTVLKDYNFYTQHM